MIQLHGGTTSPDDDESRPTPEESPGQRRGRRAIGAVMLCAILALALAPTLRAGFIYDDTEMIRDNSWLRGWSALLQLWGQPYWPTAGPDSLGLYRPMHVAMLATVWNLSGGSALAFHLYAICLAGAAALAVWWLLHRGVMAPVAFAAAVLFAVHPLHVEAIASVANTSEVLVVLGIITLVRLLVHDPGDGTGRTWGRASLVAVVAAATLLSKESGLLAMPLALITVWGWGKPRLDEEPPIPMWALLRRERRAIAGAGAALVIALIARAIVLDAPVSRTTIAAQGLDMEWSQRVVAMMSLWPRIAGLLAWPTSLSPYYGPSSFPPRATLMAVVAALALLVVTVLAVREARRGDRRPFVALAWIALTYFPASNLLVPTGQILSDRILYGATAGAVLAIAWVAERWGLRTFGTQLATALLLGVLWVNYQVESERYAKVWSSHRSLWTHLVRVAPGEHLGYKLLGMEARARRDDERAVHLLSRAHRMAPADRQIRFEHGQALYATGRWDLAAAMLGPLMRDADANGESGLVALYLDAVGRSAGAQAVIDAAAPLVRSTSASTAALFTGLALERLGRTSEAESVYLAALRTSPGDTALRARLEVLTRGAIGAPRE